MNLADKIQKIEALLNSTKSEGEREAAELAKKRFQGKVEAQKIEYTVRLRSFWTKKLFVAICQKHQLHTYRYAKQKYTTTMLRVSKSFMDEVLWPEFKKYDTLFENFAKELMLDLISKIHNAKEEETVIAGDIPFSN